jgi:protocatechuate 3,4-dioxygenase beta subunit
MENDDRPVGRILSRREALALLGGSGVGILSPAFMTGPKAQAAPANASVPKAAGCVVKPELTIGPYFVDEKLNRSDIRSEPSNGTVKPGVPVQLTFNVMDATNCAPLEGVMVDIWQCDALGSYSDIQQEGTSGQKFLRGYQLTNTSGAAHFTTIYPGWYRGRTVHTHFRIRSAATSDKTYDFVSQLFFPESVTDQVHAKEPYARHGQRDMTNSRDSIYSYGGGSQLLLALTQTTQGYAAAIDIGLVEVTQDRSRAMSQQRPPMFQPTGEQNLRSTLQLAGFTDSKVQDAVAAFATAQNVARQAVRDNLREVTQQTLTSQVTDAQAREMLAKLRKAVSTEKTRTQTATKQLDAQVHYTKNPRLELLLTTLGLIGESSYLGSNPGMMGGRGGRGGPGGPPMMGGPGGMGWPGGPGGPGGPPPGGPPMLGGPGGPDW